MLQPIRNTDARLNALPHRGGSDDVPATANNRNNHNSNTSNAAAKPRTINVRFTPQGTAPRQQPTRARADKCVHLAIRMSVRHNDHPTASKNTRTPPPQPPAVGSSCTWRDKELSQFNVTVQGNVEPKGNMIPRKFFCFDALPGFEQCTDPVLPRSPTRRFPLWQLTHVL